MKFYYQKNGETISFDAWDRLKGLHCDLCSGEITAFKTYPSFLKEIAEIIQEERDNYE